MSAFVAAPGEADHGHRLGRGASLAWPGTLLGIFFAVPFLLMVLVSLSSGPGATILSGGLTLDAFSRALGPDYLRVVAYSFGFSTLIGTLSTLVAFPFTWLIVGMRHRAQTAWLFFLLTTLSLSEVLIVFAWQIMLSRRVGLSNILVRFGILHRPENWTPSLAGLVACMVYLVLPFSILTLYPGLSRFDPELSEAARTLGASPRRTMITVTIPNLLRPIASAFALGTILSLGSYVSPLVLGRPAQWTASVLIGNVALSEGNFHAASAMALVLLGGTLFVLIAAMLGLRRLERRR